MPVTLPLARHVIEKGFISPGYFESVLRGKRDDIDLKKKPAEKLV
jgi:hypothetical protein